MFSPCPLVAACYTVVAGPESSRPSRGVLSFSSSVWCCWSRTLTQSLCEVQPVDLQFSTGCLASLLDKVPINPAEHDLSTAGVPFSFFHPFPSERIRHPWFQGTICSSQYHANADRQRTMHTRGQLETCNLGVVTNPTGLHVNCVFVNRVNAHREVNVHEEFYGSGMIRNFL